MSVAERREAVRGLVKHGLSVQRACVLVQIQRMIDANAAPDEKRVDLDKAWKEIVANGGVIFKGKCVKMI